MRKKNLQNLEIRKLFSQEEIKEAVKILAKEIVRDYRLQLEEEKENFCLVLVGILNGAVPFIGDLARELSTYFPVGTIEIDYMAISSYGGTVSGKIRLEKDTKYPLGGKHVLIVEDIIDTGKTLAQILNLLSAKNPKSLKTCVLIDKHRPRKQEVTLHYVGFTVANDKWVIGYGLDFNNIGRELPFIGYLDRIPAS
ncbi:MAG: hypoxanthine phosphoribosyltransferase [Candidatus Pacebacteria bacterium]|nr:hypoxanthine phosphoribosyltransferase [Candidatus Paceibacterota bacterium]